MSHSLRFTLRFLDPVPQFHGRRSDGDPEWPPSPLRFFQALVCAAASRWQECQFRDYAEPALRWLESRQPSVVTPDVPEKSFGYRMYVPNNSGDLMTAAWARGDTDTTMAKFRVEKDVRPTHLSREAVHYVFPLADGDAEAQKHLEVLKAAARSITHLGWGIDMVAADADILSDTEAATLPGERWRHASAGGVALRIPKEGTLDDLVRKHRDFLHRLGPDGFRPVPPLREFRVVSYRRSTEPEPRPCCVFSILKPDASGNRAFSTPRRTRDVAAWMRHAVSQACDHWSDKSSYVHGHRPDGKPMTGPDADRRLQFLPMPTINHALQRVEAIRRVLVVAPVGDDDRIADLRRRLIGQELRWRDDVFGLLTVQPGRDWVREQYIRSARVWSTVTPVILTGYDDRNSTKTRKLIARSLADAGIDSELEFEWQPFGFRAGIEPARAFARPDHLNGTMIHVRLRFKHPFPGPLAIGAGRYRGFGLFASED